MAREIPFRVVCRLTLGVVKHLLRPWTWNNTGKHQAMALSATLQLRELYNKGDYEQIYYSADRRIYLIFSPQEWQTALDGVKRQFGEWHDFTRRHGNTYPFGRPGVVWVTGIARFDAGSVQMRVDWNLAFGKARFFNIQIESKNQVTSIPGFNARPAR